jgi:hypothetical protein
MHVELPIANDPSVERENVFRLPHLPCPVRLDSLELHTALSVPLRSSCLEVGEAENEVGAKTYRISLDISVMAKCKGKTSHSLQD